MPQACHQIFDNLTERNDLRLLQMPAAIYVFPAGAGAGSSDDQAKESVWTAYKARKLQIEGTLLWTRVHTLDPLGRQWTGVELGLRAFVLTFTFTGRPPLAIQLSRACATTKIR